MNDIFLIIIIFSQLLSLIVCMLIPFGIRFVCILFVEESFPQDSHDQGQKDDDNLCPCQESWEDMRPQVLHRCHTNCPAHRRCSPKVTCEYVRTGLSQGGLSSGGRGKGSLRPRRCIEGTTRS